MEITIKIPPSDVEQIAAFLDANKDNVEHTTHGALTLERLILMLLQDLALTRTRPGSWEGSGMRTILASHGYHQ
jgi:hypothetical protein